MDTTSMNSENDKTSNLLRLLLNLTDKVDLPQGEKRVALSVLVFNTRGKI